MQQILTHGERIESPIRLRWIESGEVEHNEFVLHLHDLSITCNDAGHVFIEHRIAFSLGCSERKPCPMLHVVAQGDAYTLGFKSTFRINTARIVKHNKAFA